MTSRSRRIVLTIVFTAAATVFAAPGIASAAALKALSSNVIPRSFPNEYALGTALEGWRMDVQGEESQGYRWGYVYGSTFEGCAWVYSGAIPNASLAENRPNKCTEGNRQVTGFTNGQVWSMVLSNGKRDGLSTTIDRSKPGCNNFTFAYLNVRPWNVPTQATGYFGFQAPTGYPVRKRYTSRDGLWTMVRDPAFGAQDGEGGLGWYFVYAPCVN